MKRAERVLKWLKRAKDRLLKQQVEVKFKNAKDWLLKQPVRIAFIVFLLAAMLVGSLSAKYYDGPFGVNVLVEAHGMLLDILVIGVFILWLNQIGEKKRTIQRYRDEIDDFRGWANKEAAYRIAGNIRRLNKLGVTDIDLSHSYLVNMELMQATLQKANLFDAKLQGANLNGANFQGANLYDARLQGAKLQGALLQRAKLQVAQLQGADLLEAQLEGADLRSADLQGVNLLGANLHGADLFNANLQETNLIGAINLAAEQLTEAETLYKAKLDPDLEAEVRELNPELFDPPS